MPKLKIRKKTEGEVPDYYWCNETGSDANPGTFALPFQHRSYAKGAIPVGTTVKKKTCLVHNVISERVS